MLFMTKKNEAKPNCVSVGVYVCVSYGKDW